MNALWTALVVFSVGATTAHAAQVCPPGRPLSAPDSRYTNNGNGTITDSQTGLMWKQCSEGQAEVTCSGAVRRMTWPEAVAAGTNVSFADFDDWRLPKVDELKSLIETGCSDPAINASFFPNTYSGGYWSSSHFETDGGYVRYVEFHSGKSSYNGESTYYGVRLVRDAQ